MKVLVIAPSNDSYGVAESLMTLVLALKEDANIEPVVLTKRNNRINTRCSEAGIENYSYWYADIMAGAAYSNILLRIAKHIVKYLLFLWGNISKIGVFRCGIKFDEIDIVHTCHNRNDIGAYIAKKLKVPHVWHIREFGDEDYRVHAYKRNCIQYMNHNADYFVAISEAVKLKWIEKGIDENRLKVVYNGVDPQIFYPDGHEAKGKIRVAISSRVQPAKGQMQLVKAVAIMQEKDRRGFEVDIIGNAYSDYKAQIEKIISEEHLEEIVHFKGHSNQLSEIIRQYDIGVICSKAEAFGRVTAEYMLSGLAVIASDTGANSELIIDGKSGLLYKCGNEKDLCEKLLYLSRDRKKMKQLKEKGRERALRLFTKELYSDGMKEIYGMLQR